MDGSEESTAAPAARRGPGHRTMDAQETMAELTRRAHEISADANNKMATAMRDVIGAAAGFAAFAVESARDLVQFMVRRGQMTQGEADRLINDAEQAVGQRTKGASAPAAAGEPTPAARSTGGRKAARGVKAEATAAAAPKAAEPKAAEKPARASRGGKAAARGSAKGDVRAASPAAKPARAAAKTATKSKAPAKSAGKAATKPAAAKSAAAKPATAKPARPAKAAKPAKPAAKPAAKGAAKRPSGRKR